jgi:hypothetical protein
MYPQMKKPVGMLVIRILQQQQQQQQYIYIYIYISGGNFDDETIVYMNDYVCVKIVSIISKSAFSPILYK